MRAAVLACLLGLLAASPAAAQEVGDTVVVVMEKAKVEIRAGAGGITATVQRGVPKGSRLTIEEIDGLRYRVRGRHASGWIDSFYVLPPAEAETFLSGLIEKNPTALDHLIRGELRYERGDGDGAMADLDAAIRLDPGHARAYFLRGQLRFERGDFDRAVSDLDEVVRLSPDRPEAYQCRAWIEQTRGRIGRAIADYGEALRLDPKLFQALVNRGNLRLKMGDADGAIADFDEAVRVSPEAVSPRLGRGLAYRRKGEWVSALLDFSEATRLAPDNAVAHLNLALLLTDCPDDSIRNGPAAVAHAERAVELSKGDPVAYEALAAAHAESGDFAQAAECQRKAIEAAPEAARERLRERLGLYESGKPARAERPDVAVQAERPAAGP